MVVLDVMKVIEAVHKSFPDLDVQTVGGSETIVEIQYPKGICRPCFHRRLAALVRRCRPCRHELS
ncbi:stage V sporulation protein AA [Bacillus licheniformis]|nr:stage V sporulation protein AA [Bacillus licheniformis]